MGTLLNEAMKTNWTARMRAREAVVHYMIFQNRFMPHFDALSLMLTLQLTVRPPPPAATAQLCTRGPTL